MRFHYPETKCVTRGKLNSPGTESLWRRQIEVFRKAIIQKIKYSKTAIHQTVTRFKMFGSFQDLSRAGRLKVTSQRDDHT